MPSTFRARHHHACCRVCCDPTHSLPHTHTPTHTHDVQRLHKFESTGATWREIVRAAYFSRVNLSAQGFYATPNAGYNFGIEDPKKRGTPFSYYTNGVAVSEVEIDCLTGDFHILRSDILMDLGCSLNPSIDIGQIEGAFMQGMGWCTMEECVWGDSSHKWVRRDCGRCLSSSLVSAPPPPPPPPPPLKLRPSRVCFA